METTMNQLCCKHCGSTSLKQSAAKPPHQSRVDCADCGRWVKWGSIDGLSWKQRAEALLRVLAKLDPDLCSRQQVRPLIADAESLILELDEAHR